MSVNWDNPGSFKKGPDPRRAVGLRLVNGRTLASYAREYTLEALETIVGVMRDANARPADRAKAAEMIIDRGWGKAVSVVHMETNDVAEIRELTRDALLAIANGHTPSLPVTIDGEILQSRGVEDGAEQS
jgi:hypothetical protein